MNNKNILMMAVLLMISSCSTIGGWFSKDDQCPGGNCKVSSINNLSQKRESWHCYGIQEDRSWDCSHEAQPEKIQVVFPGSTGGKRAQTKPPEVLALSGQIKSTEKSSSAPISEAELISRPKTVNEPQQTIEQSEPQTNSSDRVRNAQPGSYVVQLIANQNKSGLVNYANQNGLQDPIIVLTQSQGNEWYILLLGIYADNAAAETARSKWESARILKARPWIRKIESLQSILVDAE